MAIEIVMPRLGWTMEEGIFGEWLKKDGEEVKSGDLLFTVESDKATQEVETFDNGILRIPPDGPKTGDVIPVGGRMGFIVKPGEAVPFETKSAESAPAPSNGAAQQAAHQSVAPSQPAAAPLVTSKTARGLPTISPRARRVAVELGVEWAQLTGSGRTGRIVERDVRAALAQQTQTPVVPATNAPAPAFAQVSPVAQRMAQAAGLDLSEVAAQKPGQRIQRQDVEAAIAARDAQLTTPAMPAATSAKTNGESVPITRIRSLIAQRMTESLQTTAPVTLTTEADATESGGAARAT